jgi:hypothetical protein
MRRSLLAALAGAAVLALASCAPRPTGVAPLDAGGRAALYRSRLAGREGRARMVVAEATLWPRGPAPCDTCPPARLPAVQADLLVLAPGSFRLRARSAFGIAVDLGLRGDSLTAYAPGLGLAAELDAVRDSFGPPAPGRLAARLVAAAWRPPAGAASRWRDGSLELLWREDADSLAVTVDEAGLPGAVRLWRGSSAGVRLRYARWETTDGVAWPVSWSAVGEGGGPGVECRVERVAFPERPEAARLEVRVPPGAERVGADELRRLLGALGEPR